MAQIHQTPSEALGLDPVDTESFLNYSEISPKNYGKFVNFCNLIAVEAPLQCANCPNIGIMSTLAFDGTSNPEQTERLIRETMDNCDGALLHADYDESGPGYECRATF